MPEMTEFSSEDIQMASAEALLDSLSLGVMKNNISQQIKGTISSQQNFLSIVIEKFEMIDKNVEDPDIRREIRYEIIDFCRDLIMEIVDTYGLYYDDDYGDSDRVELLCILYNFFVLRGKEFVCTFFINYIQQNKNSLMEAICEKSQIDMDVTTISNEKKNFQKDNIWIVSHINTVIDFIISRGVEPDEFLRVINDGDYYVDTLLSYYSQDIIGGDFTSVYMEKYVDDYNSEYSTEVRNDIRLAFAN